MVLYNEIEPYAADWLENLVAEGHIAAGRVDRRSIRDLTPADVAGYTQAHFFAGIGVWSHALRQARWPAGLPVWTGSCPCQPWSIAGIGLGVDDDRHLWPVWFELIRAQRPVCVFGEQVSSKDGLAWLDLVFADLESCGYTVGAVDLAACGVGAPHKRNRLYFFAYSDEARRQQQQQARLHAEWPSGHDADGRGEPRTYSDAAGGGLQARYFGSPSTEATGEGQRTLGTRLHGAPVDGGDPSGAGAGWNAGAAAAAAQTERGGPGYQPGGGGDRALAAGPARHGDDAVSPRLEGHFGDVREWRGPGWLDPNTARSVAEAGATRGHWADCDWYSCRDGKHRPIEPGLFPLVDGAAGRVGQLKAYGNAIVAPLATEFVLSVMDVLGLHGPDQGTL